MTSADRRARERAELNDKILSAARELFAAHGFEAVTLRKIAAAIDYTPAAIYWHFKDKDDLVRTLCVQDFDRLAETVAPMAAIADPIERIAEVGKAYARFAIEHPNHYRLMFMTPAGLEPDADALQRRGDPHRDGYAFLRLACEEAIASGRIREQYRDAELLAQTFWSGVHGVASIEIAFQRDEWIDWRTFERRVGTMIDALLRGLCLERAGETKRASTRRSAKRGRA